MKKEQKKFFEDADIADIAMAQNVVETSEKNIAKAKRGMKMGLVSLTLMLIVTIVPRNNNFNLTITNTLSICWIVTAFMTIILGGGFSKAISCGIKLARIAWYLTPFWIWDIAMAIAAGLLAIAGYFYVPVIFVWLFKRQNEKDLAVAREYLAQTEHVYYNEEKTENM